MATQTVTDVKSKLNDLKKAVSAVTKDDKVWLSALEEFFESIPPNTLDATQQEINTQVATLVGTLLGPQGVKIDQAVREVSDGIGFLQYTDKKLDERVSQSNPTSQGLGRAVVEAEAYLLLTNETFTQLIKLSDGIAAINTQGTDENFVNFKQNLKKLFPAANLDRTGLTSQVDTLLQQTAGPAAVVTLPPTEPEGTDLLLGKSSGSGTSTDKFVLLIPPGPERTRTEALLQGHKLKLSTNQIGALINSWDKAVASFVQSFKKTNTQEVVKLKSITSFLSIHVELETLYDRLETNVTRTDADRLVLSPDL